MKILQFIRALAPRLEKRDIVENMRYSIDTLDRNVIVVYKATIADGVSIKSQTNKDISETFYRNFDMMGGKKTNIVSDIAKRLENVKSNAKFVSDEVIVLFENDVLSDGLSCRKAVLLRASDSITFITNFSLDLLNYILVNETLVGISDADEITTHELCKADVNNIETNLLKYITALSVYSLPTPNFSKAINVIPEVIINQSTAPGLTALYGERALDPFAPSYLRGCTYSPIYGLGKLFVEWQVSNNTSAKEKKKMLELRLLYLRNRNKLRQDPVIENEINYTQKRVDGLSRDIKDMEDSVKVVPSE